ncbi:MAG TPA: vanadium-dependent haloperoxidase [Candidatus Limnocylindrales bacterium]|nr:vanadium-dependent haloperoxidase [Candidatus Limnocylindrales bacterium]
MDDLRPGPADERAASAGRPRRRAAGIAGLFVAAALLGVGLGIARPWVDPDACTPVPPHPGWSVAREWNEVLLDAIRRDLPAPTVHARNLYHVSAAMWDAWAAYDPVASGVFVHEKVEVGDPDAARREAMSYAAYRILESRYLASLGASDTIPALDGLMAALCYPTETTETEGRSPAALGNRIAETILAAGLADGSNEAEGYADPSYQPVNPPLVVAEPGTTLADPDRWQPLQLAQMISQNGIPIADGVQQFIGPHWGQVTSFALAPAVSDGVPVDPGPPPRLDDPETAQAYRDQAVDVLRYSALLDPADGERIDISPGSYGDNPLGTNDGTGRPLNPVTGEPYEPVVVARADFARVLAEFWADGPDSETPPGHWNTIANTVSDELDPELRIGDNGEVVGRLEWDVKLYLALNGATHDAAIAAWGLKGHYDSIRPISMIRYMGGLGQSSDPTGPSYDPNGLPLVDGLVEVVTEASSRPGQRHAGLADHVGEIAVRAWLGTPDDRKHEVGGVGWVRAVEWVPYQMPTFVTPSFAGYISGHSTFSRAAAEVLAGFTGSEYFPGGIGEWTIPAGSLEFEAGPTTSVTLSWATYFDAADQAGISRLYGGIHIAADDFAGRRVGSGIGRACWEQAQRLYAGEAPVKG